MIVGRREIELVERRLVFAAIATASQWDIAGVLTIAYFEIFAVYAVVVGIVGAVKAWRGETWRYPVNLRLIR